MRRSRCWRTTACRRRRCLGEGYCDKPFTARSIVNVSGMSFGAISKPAVQALSRGAAKAAAG
jgi:glutamate synthase domain-containing protein 2